MVEDFVLYASIAMLIYAVAPTVLARFCSLGAITRLPRGRVIITFDDGPDPRYTPRVLDVLKAAGVKACFFVVGEKARRHPDIIRTIVSEGHEIGNHGLRHRIPWLMGPMGTIREMKESFRIIQEISGSPPAAFRPPWGLLNLFSYISRFVSGHRIVLWSFMSWDWSGGMSKENILERVGKRLISGSILIFHDSDTEPGASTGSPEKMLSALPGIINILKERGYKISLLGEMTRDGGSRPSRMVKLWRIWESIFRLVMGISDVTTGEGRPTIFRISVSRYRGPRVALPEGEILSSGEKICDLHINNEYLEEILGGETSPGRIGVRAARELRLALPALAGRISRDPLFENVNFVVGITLLHRGTASAGFIPVEISSPLLKKIISFYQGLVMTVYHPSGAARRLRKGDMTPKMIVMSRSYLCSRYLKTENLLYDIMI